MKKFTLIFAIVLCSIVGSFSQIANNGFEDWTNFGSFENPDGWETMNGISAGPFYSCTKSTDHYPPSVGSYSIRLENNTSLTQMTGSFGMAITNSFVYPFPPAFPVIGHPTSLTGYFQYTPQNSDTMMIRVFLFQGGSIINLTGGLTENDAFIYSGTTSSWTPFTINFDTYVAADSASIWLSAFNPSGPTDVPNGNSILYVDNLQFDNFVTGVEDESNNIDLKIFPNPATDFIQVDIANTNKEELTMNIYNSLGQMVLCEQLQQDQALINIEGLSNGSYIVEVRSVNWSRKQSLIVRR